MCAPRHAAVRLDHERPASADSLLRQLWDDSEDEDEDGYADPIQDDLYARKVGLSPQPVASEPYNKFSMPPDTPAIISASVINRKTAIQATPGAVAATISLK